MKHITKHRRLLIFTIFLFVASFLGSKVLTVEIGPVVISPIRVALLMTPFFLVSASNDKNIVGNKTQIFSFLVFWTVYSLLLLVFVNDFGEFARHFFFLFAALIISYFASLYLTEERDFRIILYWFEIAAVIFSLIGIYEIITGDYRFLPENSIDRYRDNSAFFSTIGIRVPTGSFANPNDFGFFLLFAFCVSEALTKLKESGVGKVFSRVCTILFIFMVVATQSRAAFVSLLLGIIVIVLLSFHKMKKSTKIILVVVSLLSVSFISSLIIANKELFEALLEIDVSSGADGSDRTRLNLIENGIKILADYAFLGTGLGQLESHMIQAGHASTEGITNIHNWWAEILVSSGIIVFIYYVVLYIKTFMLFIKKALSQTISTVGSNYARLGASMLTVFLIGCMSSSSIFCIEWIWAMFVYWMLLSRVLK